MITNSSSPQFIKVTPMPDNSEKILLNVNSILAVMVDPNKKATIIVIGDSSVSLTVSETPQEIEEMIK